MGNHGKDPHRPQGKANWDEERKMRGASGHLTTGARAHEQDVARIGEKDADKQELRGGQRPGVGSRIEGALDYAHDRDESDDE